MKLLVITEKLPFGTVEAFLYPEIDWLLKRGIDLRILPAFPGGPRLHQPERDFGPLLLQRSNGTQDRIESSHFLRSSFKVFRCHGGFVRNCRKFQVNLRMARRSREFASAVLEWKPDHIHAHWANYTSTMAWCLSKHSGIPWSFTTQRYDIVYDNLFRLKAESAVFVRFPSKKARDLAAQFCGFEDHQRSMVSYMGVVIPAQASRPEGSEWITAAVPANLLPVKGHRYLLEALAALDGDVKRKLKVRLFGDGVLRASIAEQISALNLGEMVSLEGQVAQSKLHELYHLGKIHFVILPSVDLGNGHHEGLPFSLIEAMAFGLPVISTRTGGISELVTEGSGFLVPDKSARDLKNAIETMVRDTKLRFSLGENARERAMRDFSQEDNAQSFLRRIIQASALQGE